MVAERREPAPTAIHNHEAKTLILRSQRAHILTDHRHVSTFAQTQSHRSLRYARVFLPAVVAGRQGALAETTVKAWSHRGSSNIIHDTATVALEEIGRFEFSVFYASFFESAVATAALHIERRLQDCAERVALLGGVPCHATRGTGRDTIISC